MKLLILLFSILTIGLPLFAAEPSDGVPSGNAYAPVHSLSVEINTTGMFGIGVGYSCRFVDVFSENDISVHAKFSLPLGLVLTSKSMDSFKLEAGTELDMPVYKGFHIPCYAGLFIMNQRQVLGSFFSFGGSFTAAPGLYLQGGHIAVETGIEHVFVTRIVHSSVVKKTFSGRHEDRPDVSSPLDGIYGSTATRFRLGLSSSLALGRVFSLQLNGGLLLTPSIGIGLFEGMPFGLLPFYSELGAVVSFP